MKTAKARPIVWSVECPECGEGVENEEGSTTWSEGIGTAQTTATCLNGHRVRVPKFLRGEVK